MGELRTYNNRRGLGHPAVSKTLIATALPVSTYSPDPDTVSLQDSQPCAPRAPEARDNQEL